MVGKIEELINEFSQLSKEELRQFRAWDAKFESDEWDKQIEMDAKGGNMDKLASRAITEYKVVKQQTDRP